MKIFPLKPEERQINVFIKSLVFTNIFTIIANNNSKIRNHGNRGDRLAIKIERSF